MGGSELIANAGSLITTIPPLDSTSKSKRDCSGWAEAYAGQLVKSVFPHVCSMFIPLPFKIFMNNEYNN